MVTVICNLPALICPIITSLYTSNSHSSFASYHISPPPLNFLHRRHRCLAKVSSFVLPLLPFPIDQALVPSEVKTLHLYEARYIALLEESLFQKNKLFVHFVIDPAGFSDTSIEASFARYCCLVIIEKVERLEIGALVLIRGVGRVKVLEFKQALPYLTGEVTSLQDEVLQNMTDISSKVLELKEVLHSLNSLEIKLKTKTANSLVWAEKQLTLDCSIDFIPSVAERVSFAAFQPVSGASRSELAKLQREKLIAMDVTDTQQRLKKSIELARANISMLAAKLAIQSLEMR